MPAAAATGPVNGYCENVKGSVDQEMPKETGKAIVQTLSINSKCQVVLSPAKEISVAEFNADAPTGMQSAVLGSASSNDGAQGSQDGVTALAATSYVGYSSTRVYDCCGILLTEHWVQNRWTSSNTSTGVITAWSATHGAKWHDEAGPVPGWYLDNNVSSLGLVEGGLNKTYERVKGRQGFKYQGAFDPTGNLFYNDLSDWVRGSRTGALTCTHAYNLRRVPAGPLAWPAPKVACVRGAYPNP